MTADSLKVLELITSKIVELAYVGLFAYVARLGSDFLKYRLDVLGKDARIFIPRDPPPPTRDEADGDDTAAGHGVFR
jgi:hypothetical protein